MNFQSYVKTMELLKKQGVSKEEVLDVLEFDSDQYPDMNELKAARDHVYGKADEETMMNEQVVSWINGSPETNAKELMWQLMDMGVYVNEEEIRKVVDQRLRQECACPDDSGSCESCLIRETI